MKDLLKKYAPLFLAFFLIVTICVACSTNPPDPVDTGDSDTTEAPSITETEPVNETETEENATIADTEEDKTDDQTTEGTEAPTEEIWDPDVIAWYDIDNGSSLNGGRPDRGWFPMYQQSPGLVTEGGHFRTVTPLLGTYDQIDPEVAKQHLYWLGSAGFDAVVVDITNYNSRETSEDFQRYMRGLMNNTKVLLQAAKDMSEAGYQNVPQVILAPRLFGTDFEALEVVLDEIYSLCKEYPNQVYRMEGERAPLVLVFCDWDVFNEWGNNPPENVDNRMDIRYCNGYLDRYGRYDRETEGWAIPASRNMFLFVENKKGETEGSYAPIYTVGKDGEPEVMCSSVSVHGGWNTDGSNWDAMNNLIDGKTPLERTLEPVYAIKPDVVIVNRFNYAVAWMEEPQEGLGLYHSGHFEPCEDIGFEMYDHVQEQVHKLKSLEGVAPAKPVVVSESNNCLFLGLDGNPLEYRIGENESFEGAEWTYYNISVGVDYSFLASLDQIWVQTRNSFGESEAVKIDINGVSTGEPGSYTVEFDRISFNPMPSWLENPFTHSSLPAEVSEGSATYMMLGKDETVSFSIRVGAKGTYRLILRCVTDSKGPTLRFAVDGTNTRNKVSMANGGGGWTYTEYDLGLVTMTAGKHEITITAIDKSTQPFVLDNLYIRLAAEGETDPEPEPETDPEPEETEPPIDADYVFEFDELTYDPKPSWSEIPYTHIFLPVEVSNDSAAFMSMQLDEEAGVIIQVDKAGTYQLTLNIVTNTRGPILQFYLNGEAIGETVDMSNTVGSWNYESIELAKVTFEAGTHRLSFQSVGGTTGEAFIMDNVLLNEVDPSETEEPGTDTEEPGTDTEEPGTEPEEPVEPEAPKTYVFEFDSLTYNPMPHWSEIPFAHGALPDGVTDKSAANLSLNLDEQVSVTLTVDQAGSYLLTFNAVTNSSGPILQISVNGQDAGGKIKMGDSNQWKYISYNLGYVTLNEGENTLSIRSVDVTSEASFILDNVVLTPVDVDAATEFSYEFDQMTFVQNPSWMDKPFVNGALPEGVTDKKAIFATIPLDTETVMTFSVAKEGTYSIIFNGVTDTNGPTLQFFIDGTTIGGKINMANGGGGWTFASFDLGKLTLTAGVHTLTVRGVDVDSDSPCVMDRLVLVSTEPDEPVEPEEPESYVYEFDTIEFVTKPTWSEIPFIHGALPEDVTEGKAIFATIRLDTETVINFSVAKEGTYNIILNAVTDTNGPTLQFLIDGTAIGDKVNMAKAGGWTYASFDLGKLTLTEGVHTLTIRGVDVDVDSPCVMDNLVLVPTQPDEPVDPEEPESYVYEFDTIEFVTKPTWSEIPFAHGALPEGVTDKKGIYATIPLDTETVMTFSVPKDGTYSIVFNGVTDTNGPTLQFMIDGTAIGDKVNMAKAGGWTYASFDLGKLTLTEGVHTLTIRGVDVDSDSPCVMDNLVLVPKMA